MTRFGRMLARMLVLGALCAACAARPAGAQTNVNVSSRALSEALRTKGRAEASVSYMVPALPGVPPRAVHATLALEPPDRARLDVTSSGEKLVLRADGGEWLQPAAKQLLRFKPQHAAAPLLWWRVLMGEERSARERRSGEAWVLTLLDGRGAAVDSARVWLDTKGLPNRLEVGDGSGANVTYRLAGWRFLHARGAAGFKLQAPAGFETVELP